MRLALTKQPGAYWLSTGSRFPSLGSSPMLLVVITPTSGMWSKMYWMIGVAVVTIPEGMVKGPERLLPKKSVFKVGGSGWGCQAAQVYWFGPV